VAVASAGTYASLHLAPDRQPRQTGRMPFLPPNQQRQSTEGNNFLNIIDYLNTYLSVYLFICFCMLVVVLSSHIAATTAELLVIW